MMKNHLFANRFAIRLRSLIPPRMSHRRRWIRLAEPRRLMTLLLVFTLLASYTPAAPVVIIDLAAKTRANFSIWADNPDIDPNGLRVKLPRWLGGPANNVPKRPKSQRSAHHARIFARKLKLRPGQQHQFSALVLDESEQPIDGLRFDWSSNQPEIATVDESGLVKAVQPGEADITARSGSFTESVRVYVAHNVPEEDIPDPKFVSPGAMAGLQQPNSSLTKGYTLQKAAYRPKSSPPPAPMFHMGTTDPLIRSIVAPTANLGAPPNAPKFKGGIGPLPAVQSAPPQSTLINPASSNATVSFPIATLSGRGDNSASLAAVYNSQTWVYDSTSGNYYYNAARDWPGPGFSLNFGRINSQTVGTTTTYVLITPDGTRHQMQLDSSGFIETSDGTFIRVNTTEVSGGLVCYYPDGTRIVYDQAGPDSFLYASSVRDRNGNYFTVTYTSTMPQIDHVTDNLGNTIQFSYTSGITITAPDQGGTRRTVMQIDFTTITVNGTFSPNNVVLMGSGTTSFSVPSHIYNPTTGRGTVFTYSAYGMISRFSQHVSMTSSSTGTEVAYTDYNYPATAASLTAVPAFTTRQESWSGADVTVPVSYTYATSNDGTYNIYSVTDPTGRIQVQKTPMTGSTAGALSISEVQDSSGNPLQRATTTYGTDGLSGSVQVSAVTSTDVPASLSTQVAYTYDGNYNNPTAIKEYDFGGALLRETDITYVTSTNYTAPAAGKPMLLNLPLSRSILDSYGNQVAYTTLSYDSTTLTDRTESGGAVNGHDRTDFPTTFTYRGNPTSIQMYPDPVNSPSTYIQQQTSYDILGNTTSAAVSCCEQKTFSYSSANHFAWPASVTSGSGVSLTSSYTYDASTGLTLSSTDPNSRTTSYSFQTGTLRPTQTTGPTGAYSTASYDDVNLTVTSATYNSSSTQVELQENFQNGIGQTKEAKRWAGGTAYDRIDFQYDAVGRMIKNTNPYRDGIGSQLWTTVTYDNLDRATLRTSPDSQTVAYAYLGQYLKVTDQVGRQHINQVDALGRLANAIEVVAATSDYVAQGSITTPWGSINGYTTGYSYNLLDKLTQISQGGQMRLMVYDALGRILYEREPELGATISYGGINYSKKYEWDANNPNNLRRMTDSRGAVTTFFYDGLNRPVARIYSGSPTANNVYNFWDGNTSVSIASDSFGGGFTKTLTPLPSGFSITSNSLGRLSASVVKSETSPTTGNVGSTGGDFNQYGADGQVTAAVERIGGTDYQSQTSYNSLLMPTSLTYPSGRQINYSYDSAIRPSGITDNGTSVNYVSNLAYNSAGQITGFNLGNGTTESYGYDTNRLEMTSQSVTKGTSTLLSLSYGYNASSGQNGSGTTAGNSGQLMTMTDNVNSSGTVNYTYDLLNRLKTAQTPSSGWSVQEEYDRYGNRWLQDRAGNTTTLPASGFGTITVTGSEQSEDSQVCDLYDDGGGCVHYRDQPPWDSGTIGVTIGGFTASAFYAQGSTSAGLATDLTNGLNAAGSPVTATVSGTTITVTANALGSSTNYTLTSSATSDYPSNFSPSFFPNSYGISGGSNGSLGSGGSGPTSSLAYDLNNHISSAGYTYDNAGNLTNDGVNGYTYDGENRMTAAGTATYSYNGTGARVSRTASSVTTNYIYGSSGQILAYQQGGTWHDYVSLGTRLIADVTSSTITYHHTDRLSSRLLTNSSGSTLLQQQAAPFGEIVSSSGSGSATRIFSTYERDSETGNDYAINRQYGKLAGRFTQPDPLGLGASDATAPQSFNEYNYTGNDPINGVDPTGTDMMSLSFGITCTSVWVDNPDQPAAPDAIGHKILETTCTEPGFGGPQAPTPGKTPGPTDGGGTGPDTTSDLKKKLAIIQQKYNICVRQANRDHQSDIDEFNKNFSLTNVTMAVTTNVTIGALGGGLGYLGEIGKIIPHAKALFAAAGMAVAGLKVQNDLTQAKLSAANKIKNDNLKRGSACQATMDNQLADLGLRRGANNTLEWIPTPP